MISFLSFEVIQQDLGFVVSMLMFDWLLIKPFYIIFHYFFIQLSILIV